MKLTHRQLLAIAQEQLDGLADDGSITIKDSGYFKTVYFTVNDVPWKGQTDEENQGVFYMLHPSDVWDENGNNIEAKQLRKSLKKKDGRMKKKRKCVDPLEELQGLKPPSVVPSEEMQEGVAFCANRFKRKKSFNSHFMRRFIKKR